MSTVTTNPFLDRRPLHIVSDTLSLILTQQSLGTFMTQLTNAQGVNLLRQPTPLWSAQMISVDMKRAALNMTNLVPTITQRKETTRLTWLNTPIEGAEKNVRVKVDIICRESATLHWHLTIDHVPDDWSVCRVHFPKFDLAVEPNSTDTQMIVPCDLGVAYPDPLNTMPTGGIHEKVRKRPYPHGGFTMQFVALQQGDQLLYLAAHDPTPVLKTFDVGPNLEEKHIYVHLHTDTAIAYGETYQQNYPWVTRLLRGDWYDATQVYRQFVTRSASWTRCGALAESNKTPKWYQKMGMVGLRLHRGTGYEAEDLLEDRAFLKCPFVSHYYMWHQCAFDSDYPFMFPAEPGFRKSVSELKNAGVYVMPYYNPFSCDMGQRQWEQGLKHLAVRINEQHDLDVHLWSQNKRFATMCPGAQLWRDITHQSAMRLLENGCNAIYFDEIATSAPFPCYDPNHQHPLGGGDTFAKGYRTWIQNVRNESKTIHDELVVTTEGCSEVYIDQVDAFLIGNANSPYAVPLFSAVYHDYVMGFGRYTFTPELTNLEFDGAIVSKHAQQFIWGFQFGWSRIPLSAIRKQAPRIAEFLRHLAHTWLHHSDFMACGKMLRPLDFSDQLQPITRLWARSYNDNQGTPVSLMPILNGVWQRRDGSIAMVLVNLTEKPIDLQINLPSIQKQFGTVQPNGIPVELDEFMLNRVYPLPQNTMAEQHEVDKDLNLIKTIAKGDSEHGYQVTIPGWRVVTLVVGSEKDALYFRR